MGVENSQVKGVKVCAVKPCKISHEVAGLTAKWDEGEGRPGGFLFHSFGDKESIRPNRCAIVSFANWRGLKKGVGVLWIEGRGNIGTKNSRTEGVKIGAAKSCKLLNGIPTLDANWASWGGKGTSQERSLRHAFKGLGDFICNKCVMISFAHWNGFKKGLGILWAEE